MRDIFFTIITPNYNTEHFLEECLQSIKNQTFENYEHLVIDDKSPHTKGGPKFEQVIKKVKNNKIKVFKNKSNEGVSISRNKCLDQAAGKFIIFLDADDYAGVDLLQNIHNELMRYQDQWEQTIFSLSNIQRFDSETGGLSEQPLVAHKPKHPSFTKELVFFSLTNPSLVLNRDLLGDFRYTPGLQFGEEPDLYFRLYEHYYTQNTAQKLKIKYLQASGLYYREHAGQYSSAQSEKEFSNYQKLYERLLKLNSLNVFQKFLIRITQIRYGLYSNQNKAVRVLAKPLTLFSKVITGWYV